MLKSSLERDQMHSADNNKNHNLMSRLQFQEKLFLNIIESLSIDDVRRVAPRCDCLSQKSTNLFLRRDCFFFHKMKLFKILRRSTENERWRCKTSGADERGGDKSLVRVLNYQRVIDIQRIGCLLSAQLPSRTCNLRRSGDSLQHAHRRALSASQ